jgi:hypothetical protein
MIKLSDIRPIRLEEPIKYLNDKTFLYPRLIYEFTQLSEEQIAAYNFPSYVSEEEQRILKSRYGKDSHNYKDFYTATTAISILVVCAKINQDIKELNVKYGKRYSYGSSLNEYFDTECETAIHLKKILAFARDKINCYNKSYTVDGFELGFIGKFQTGIKGLCYNLLIDTETPLKTKVAKTVDNSLGCMVFFIFFCISFSLFAKFLRL